MTSRAPVDVLAVTALGLEREAVRAHLIDLETLRVGATTADVGRFSVDEGHLTVAIIETGSGNIDAATATGSALRDLRPNVVLTVGIGGGAKDVEIGDVVASRKIYWVEPGKQILSFDNDGSPLQITRTRPDFGPVSARLVQTARAVVADNRWQSRGRSPGGAVRLSGGPAEALVAAMAVGEKVLAADDTELARTIREQFSDAAAVAMEDVGVTRTVAELEQARTLSIRGISDLLSDKSVTDAQGAQPLAAANAAAFAFELLHSESRLATGAHARPRDRDVESLVALGAELYPGGPTDQSIWTRAGGDLSTISLTGNGRTQWWNALNKLDLGGGGRDISTQSLLDAMGEDYPGHSGLEELRGRLR